MTRQPFSLTEKTVLRHLDKRMIRANFQTQRLDSGALAIFGLDPMLPPTTRFLMVITADDELETRLAAGIDLSFLFEQVMAADSTVTEAETCIATPARIFGFGFIADYLRAADPDRWPQ